MYCKQCGAEIEDGARFCGKCGAQQEAAQEQMRSASTGQSASTQNGKDNKKWKIFACVKIAAILIAFIIFILFDAKYLGFIGRPKGMSFQEFWVEREYETYESGKQFQIEHGLDVTVEIPEPEVAEYLAKEHAAKRIKESCKFVGANFVIVIILLIPTFLIFRGKKSKILTVFEVLSSTISVLLVVFFLFLVSQSFQSF